MGGFETETSPNGIRCMFSQPPSAHCWLPKSFWPLRIRRIWKLLLNRFWTHTAGMSMHLNPYTHTHRLFALVTVQTLRKISTQSAIQRHIPALIQSQVWCMLKVAPYYLLVKGMSHWREQVVTDHFNFPPLQAGRPGGVKRLAASDDSSPLMSITAINSTPGRMA